MNYILVIHPAGRKKARSIFLLEKLVPRSARNDGFTEICAFSA